jgi:hypothetical protein
MDTLRLDRSDRDGRPIALIGTNPKIHSWVKLLPMLSDRDLIDLPEVPGIPTFLLQAAERLLAERGTGNVSNMAAILNSLPWKPVSDSLPDSDLTALIACADGNGPVWLGSHDGDQWLTVEGNLAAVTHWMPLPEPPTK